MLLIEERLCLENTIQAALIELGLTGLEAEIYLQLLAESPLTGYAIARQIGKPTANTYKALDSLHDKGAVLLEHGKTRLYRAVPAEDLLAALERRHVQLGKRVLAAAARLNDLSTDDRVYHVGSADQVFQQFRRMLTNATRVAVFDLFPQPCEMLRDELVQAAARGVQVVVKTYTPVSIPGVDTLQHANPQTLKRWPGEWANGVIDGIEYQVAFLSPDCQKVRLAVWSGSAYLAWIYHHGLVSEFIATAISRTLNENGSPEALRESYERYRELLTIEAPGLSALMRRFDTDDNATPQS